MIQGARALVYERYIEPIQWHICCNGGDMHIHNVPVLCGRTIQSIGDNVYVGGETIENYQDRVCSICIEKARQQVLPLDEEASI